MELRPEVAAFAQLMEAKLRQHDTARGPTGWKGALPLRLFQRLSEEGNELQSALWNHLPGAEIADEAADVANMAMMIADVAGGLLMPTPPRNEAAEQLALLPPTPGAEQLALPAEQWDE